MDSFLEEARRIEQEMVLLRRAIHRHPEIGLDLPQTQAKVLSALQGLPLEITTGSGLTSVTGILRGSAPGPTVLLRADMDALPVNEETGLEYASEIPGRMHACGHDLHTAMLVGAAKLLSGRRDQLAGDVVFMFQPGEEGYDGAGAMLTEGVLDASGTRPVAAYALHVAPGRDVGTFFSRAGALLAASDTLEVRVTGRGGHGALPHLAIDPIPATSALVTALYTALSRENDPFAPTILTVGRLAAGTAPNVIPDVAELSATVRTLSPESRESVRSTVERVCEGVARTFGVEMSAVVHPGYDATINDVQELRTFESVITDMFGDAAYEQLSDPLPGAEDFSRVLAEIPGALVFLGARPAEVARADVSAPHSAGVRFDDGAAVYGAAVFAELARRRLING